MRALILAGGKGRNLVPITETRPKSMINICGKPVLEYIILGLKDIGINDQIIVLGHQKEKIKSYFGRGDRCGVSITYAEQKETTSIGGAVMSAQKLFSQNEYFFLVYGDIVFSPNIFLNTLISFNSIKGPTATICLPPAPGLYGNIYMDKEVQITKIIEKPVNRKFGNYILAGVFILPTDFFKLLSKVKSNMEKAFDLLVKDVGLHASIFEEDWIDLGYPWNVIDANKILMKSIVKTTIPTTARFEDNVRINGPVFIEDNVTIKAGATINGPCYIGADSFVGNNSLIREYTSLGARSLVGYGVEIKNSIIFDKAKIGRLSFIGDSIIGDSVDIGSGVMTVNTDIEKKTIKTHINGKYIDSKLEKLGAFIGDDAVIGASNTILPGTIIPHKAKIPHKGSI
ncbi:MAG: hypothetical protein A2043_06465 [Candidatus Schekmanbacteria bacterium GWA2_38_9]|nr:MAG: hypothetical protein A2043_06465 [Candidatus Schekmanbacteria bacterium GWA2_38_9]OGL50782.1 MAG: hypothetical protein A3H37_02920 [Candidatus Schekmanbacteria bacterium RIFCSPLOWO2_02_FULL_38_14]